MEIAWLNQQKLKILCEYYLNQIKSKTVIFALQRIEQNKGHGFDSQEN